MLFPEGTGKGLAHDYSNGLTFSYNTLGGKGYGDGDDYGNGHGWGAGNGEHHWYNTGVGKIEDFEYYEDMEYPYELIQYFKIC